MRAFSSPPTPPPFPIYSHPPPHPSLSPPTFHVFVPLSPLPHHSSLSYPKFLDSSSIIPQSSLRHPLYEPSPPLIPMRLPAALPHTAPLIPPQIHHVSSPIVQQSHLHHRSIISHISLSYHSALPSPATSFIRPTFLPPSLLPLTFQDHNTGVQVRPHVVPGGLQVIQGRPQVVRWGAPRSSMDTLSSSNDAPPPTSSSEAPRSSRGGAQLVQVRPHK